MIKSDWDNSKYAKYCINHEALFGLLLNETQHSAVDEIFKNIYISNTDERPKIALQYYIYASALYVIFFFFYTERRWWT